MDKSIWVICADSKMVSAFEEMIKSEFAGKSSCPPNKKICTKNYNRGCYGCWAEWLRENVEFVKDGEQE